MPLDLVKKHSVGLVLSLCLLFLLPPVANAKEDATKKPAETSADKVIASMGDVKLMASELNRLFAYSDPKARNRVLTNPKLLEQTVREELFKKFIVQQSSNTGFSKQPQVQWAVDRAGENVLLELYLNSNSKPEDNFPPETMLKEAYQQNLVHFQVPVQVHVAQIFLPTDGDEKNKKETHIKINDLAAKAKKANADFASLAKEHSKHAESASAGGDMGWIPLNQLLPEVSKVAESMKVGEIKGPIQSPQGFHVVKLLETKPASTRSFEEAKPVLIAGLKKQRMEVLRAQFLKNLLEKVPVVIDNESISKLK
ncbi:MAG: peptidylprolyl isomerase [Magnetococcales bacterium]|nr:peptidylprolyl isomerase [Magnetococcales bacterium]HIJ83128.1 peptidylprolyl isomerase [Magnetococcales bacterium]